MPFRRAPRVASSPPRGEARSTALRLLMRRDYTTTEITRKLAERGYSADAIDAAVQSLTGAGLLDDRRVAASHIRTATGVKGRGRLRVQRELEARGVDRALARQLFAERAPDEEAAALARAVARLRPPGTLGPLERRRLFQRLLRRGFAADAIAKALGRRGDDEDA